jgi:hypothetical protein
MMRAVVVPSLCVTAQCRGAHERNHKTNRTRRMLVGPRQRGHRSKADWNLARQLLVQKDAAGATSVK